MESPKPPGKEHLRTVPQGVEGEPRSKATDLEVAHASLETECFFFFEIFDPTLFRPVLNVWSEKGDLSGFAILHREVNSTSLRCF